MVTIFRRKNKIDCRLYRRWNGLSSALQPVSSFETSSKVDQFTNGTFLVIRSISFSPSRNLRLLMTFAEQVFCSLSNASPFTTTLCSKLVSQLTLGVWQRDNWSLRARTDQSSTYFYHTVDLCPQENRRTVEVRNLGIHLLFGKQSSSKSTDCLSRTPSIHFKPWHTEQGDNWLGATAQTLKAWKKQTLAKNGSTPSFGDQILHSACQKI